MNSSPTSTSKGADSPVEIAGGFPRHLTQELLDEDAQREGRHRWLAPWFLGAAFTSFALSFPIERVVGNFPMKAEAGEGVWWMLIEAVGGEAPGFLLSALAAGLFIPLMTHALLATGVPRGPSLTAALCVGLSPLMGHAATLPGPEAAAGLLSLVAFWITAPHGAGSTRTSAAIVVGIGATLLDQGCLLILPALLIRHFSRSGTTPSSPMYGWYGFAWAVAWVAAMQLMWSMMVPDAPVSQDSRVLRYAIFPGVLGLGLSLLATCALFSKRKEGLTENTPGWLRLWIVGGVASLLFPGASGICLAPVAAFAIADFLSRGIVSSWTASVLILIGQLLLTFGAVHHVRTRDPHYAWRLEFQEIVLEGDRLVSHDPAHRYLARIRWGYKTSHASDPLGVPSPPYVLDLGNQPPFLRRVDASSRD